MNTVIINGNIIVLNYVTSTFIDEEHYSISNDFILNTIETKINLNLYIRTIIDKQPILVKTCFYFANYYTYIKSLGVDEQNKILTGIYDYYTSITDVDIIDKHEEHTKFYKEFTRYNNSCKEKGINTLNTFLSGEVFFTHNIINYYANIFGLHEKYSGKTEAEAEINKAVETLNNILKNVKPIEKIDL